MPEQVRVRFNRKLSQKIGDNFDTSELGGEWEFTIPDGADIQAAFDAGYVVLRRIVEDRFEGGYVMPPRTLPGEHISPKPVLVERSFPPTAARKDDYPEEEEHEESDEFRTFESGETLDDIVERQPVLLARSRVWDVKDLKTKANKRYATLRVGNRDHIPTGYARVKTYEPELINRILALQEGDYVDVWGHYESWQGTDSVMWDFIPSRIERSSAKK